MAEDDRRAAREVILGALVGPRPSFDADAVIARMLQTAEMIDVRPGDVLGTVDGPSDAIFVMAEGRVRLSRPGVADWVYRGRWAVGTTDAVLRRRRRRTIVVEVPGRMVRMPARAYLELIEEYVAPTWLTLVGLAHAIDALFERLGGEASPPAGRTPSPLSPRSVVGRLALIEGIPLLAGATLQAAADIAQDATVEDLEAGALLVEPGRPDPRLFVVARGGVGLERGAVARGRFGPGQLVGGVAWHVGRDGAFRATALEPSTIVAFSVDAWLDRMEEHPSLAVAGVAALTAELERLQEELAARTGELVLD